MDNQRLEEDGVSGKKGIFDNLSRDDLIKKCKGLLSIAKTAKQAKDELQEENKTLREEIQNFETQKHADKECLKAMQELVESLTQDKLASANKQSDMHNKIIQLENLLKESLASKSDDDQYEIEIDSCKSRIKRLLEENDVLLNDFEILEKKYENLASEQSLNTKDDQLNELQTEITSLKNDIEILNTKKLKTDEKIKLFKTKILDFSQKLKQLKASREILIEIVTDYSQTIPNWQTEISKISTKIFEKVLHYEKENKSLINKIVILEEKCSNFNVIAKILTETFKCTDAEIVEKVNHLLDQFNQLQSFKQETLILGPTVNEKLETLQNQIEIHRKQNFDNLEVIKTLNEKLDNETNNNSKLQVQLDQTKSDLLDFMNSIENSKHEHENQLEKSKEIVEQQKTVNKTLRLDIENLLETIKLNQNIIGEFEEELISKTKEINSFLQDRDDCINKITLLNKELAVLISTKQKNEEICCKIIDYFINLSHGSDSQNQKLYNEKNSILDLLKDNNLFSDQLIENFKISLNVLSGFKNKDVVDQLNTKLSQSSVVISSYEETLESTEKNIFLSGEIDNLNEMLEKKQKECNDVQTKLTEIETSIQNFKVLESEYTKNLEVKENEIEIFKKQIEEYKETLEKQNAEITLLNQQLNEISKSVEQQQIICNQKENEIIRLVEEGQILEQKLTSMTKIIDEKANSVKSSNMSVERAKLENQDLLNEMKELNQVFKERGGVISKQQSKILELESRLVELDLELKDNRKEAEQTDRIIQGHLNELKISKEILIEKDRVIENLNEDLQTFKDKGHVSMDNQSEILSNSTISRADEQFRLREIEDSFEEKYNKLRMLAIKLKKKVAEQIKQIAILEEKKSFSSNINSEQLEETKLSKKEIESLNILLKNKDENIKKLSETIATKDNTIKEMIEKEQTLKVELEKTKTAAKKSNVLSLEMDAYEKSLNELNQKLEIKKIHANELEATIETLNETVKSMKSQLKLVEESLQSEKLHSKELKQKVDSQQNTIKENEHQKSELNLKYSNLETTYESFKLAMDECKIEMSANISEKDKLCNTLISEKENILRQIYNLEDELSNVKQTLNVKEHEMDNMKKEFSSYKIRAQSVLRDNQSRESVHEAELEDEVLTLRTKNDALSNKIKSILQEQDNLNKNLTELKYENEKLEKKTSELSNRLEESRLQSEAILEDAKKQNIEHQDIIKTQRVRINSLNNCYKSQIDEMEQKYAVEIESLKEKLNHVSTNKNSSQISTNIDVNVLSQYNSATTTDEQKIQMILQEREVGDNPENNNSQSKSNVPSVQRKISHSRNRHEIIPLDELLNSSFEETVSDERPVSPSSELKPIKEKLIVQESRVKHLTTLLAEAEQDLVRLTQLNEVLKEEVRRQQRSLEREQHIHNSEYIKNVILKFLTLSSGDEKSHLVPVLNTILRLSPEETQKLHAVAKGGEGSSWLGKIPLWSNNN